MKAGLFLWFSMSACLTQFISAQDAANSTQTASPLHAPSPSHAPGVEQGAEACPRFADRDWPIHLTIQARITSMMDSAHLKPGKEVYAKVMYPITYADCSLDDDAILYGHVTGASSLKDTKPSELGLVFDHADCAGHQKEEVHLRLIGIIAPPERSEMMHSVLPSEVAGGVMGLPSTSQDGIDENLKPENFPRTIRPGLVVRMSKVSLEPEGGPGCSAKISGSDRPVQLVPGTALILTLGKVAQPKP